MLQQIELFHVSRDDLFVRLPKGGKSPKQKVVFQTQAFCLKSLKLNDLDHVVLQYWGQIGATFDHTLKSVDPGS